MSSARQFVKKYIQSTYTEVASTHNLETKGETFEAQQSRLAFAIEALQAAGADSQAIEEFKLGVKLLNTEMEAIELRLQLESE